MKLTGDDLEHFLEYCKKAGIKVTPGSGKVTRNGEPVDIKEALDAAFPGKEGKK